MRPQFAFGFDFGNSTVVGMAFLQDRRYGAITFPSLSAPGSSANLEKMRSVANLPTYGQDDYLLTYDNRETYLGKLAFESRDATSARGDANRYWSTRSLEALLVASASIIRQPDYEVFVVTGLPVETYTKENRKRVREALEGEHGFFLNGRSYHAIVHVSQVIMEGAGAIIAHGDDRDVRQGAIDIGGRTTDLFATKGQTPRTDLCQGKPLGVETVGGLLAAMIRENLAGHVLETEDMYQVLRAYGGDGSYPELYFQGEQISAYNLVNWTHQAVEQVAKNISSFVAATWSSNEHGSVASGFARVILVGGGAYFFHRQMRKLIPNLIVPQEPELANAHGYGALSSALGIPAHIRIA